MSEQVIVTNADDVVRNVSTCAKECLNRGDRQAFSAAETPEHFLAELEKLAAGNERDGAKRHKE